MATRPYCSPCRSTYRTWAEHATTQKHRASTTTIRSTGARGSAAYKPPAVLPRSMKDYEDWLEEKAYTEATIVSRPPQDDGLPSIDTLPPAFVGDPPPERERAVRSIRPDPCPRCGAQQKTQAGATWHLVNNPQCEKWAPAKRRYVN